MAMFNNQRVIMVKMVNLFSTFHCMLHFQSSYPAADLLPDLAAWGLGFFLSDLYSPEFIVID